MQKVNVIIVLALGLMAACSSSKKTSQNQASADKITTKSFHNVFIEVATVDVQVRNELEKAIAASFVAEGFSAVKSIDVIPFSLKELKLPTQEEIELKVKENGCDAILIVSLSRKGEAVNYTPGVTRKENNLFLASLLGDILHKGHYISPTPADIPAVDVQGKYSTVNAAFVLQGNLFDAASQERVFANQSTDLDINLVEKFSKPYAAGLVAALKKEKLLSR